MKNISFKNVELTDGYWKRKQLLNENVTLDSVYNRFYDTGRIEAFKCDWEEDMEKKPHIFWDSDVAKWIEAAAYILQKKEDKVLENKIDYIVDLIKQWLVQVKLNISEDREENYPDVWLSGYEGVATVGTNRVLTQEVIEGTKTSGFNTQYVKDDGTIDSKSVI